MFWYWLITSKCFRGKTSWYSKYWFVSASTINTPTLSLQGSVDQKYENESIQVIKSISNIIKDVLNKEKDTQGKSDYENIVEKIQNQVPKDVKIKTPQIDNSELKKKITETVGILLTDEEIESIVLLRNVTASNGKSIPPDELENPPNTDNDTATTTIVTTTATTATTINIINTTTTTNTITTNIVTSNDITPFIKTEAFDSETTTGRSENVEEGDTTISPSTFLGQALLPGLSIVSTSDSSDSKTAINPSYEASSKGIKHAHYIWDL